MKSHRLPKLQEIVLLRPELGHYGLRRTYHPRLPVGVSEAKLLDCGTCEQQGRAAQGPDGRRNVGGSLTGGVIAIC